nr:hypothetical protein [uncultured Massilia sp.]
MADAQPTMDMDGSQAAATAQVEAPSLMPPGAQGDPMPPAGAMMQGAAMTEQPGTLRAPAGPPDMQAAPSLPVTTTGVAAGIAAWQSGKKVDSLWTINQDGNSWFGVAGIGWKKLAHPNETAVSALTMLVAHARATGAPINYRDEADNMVHEIYVW